MALLDASRLRDPFSSDEILNAFLEYLIETGVEPYDHQEQAILELLSGNNVILNTPTGSGKSLVALAMQFRAICQNRHSYYTVPIKALANEKFLSLCRVFGPEKVGMITGDATVNPHAPVICCTAEILANLALREGAFAQVDDVIMDEFHYYSDHSRGFAWQVPLLTLPQSQFLLMSATLGDTAFFEECLNNLTGKNTVLVKSEQRPVPLEFDYSEEPLEEKINELVEAGKAPIYLVHFTQLACAGTAQNLLSSNFCTREEKQKISEALHNEDFRSPYGKEVQKFLRHGIGIHHAGLLPKYRLIVEKLTQQGLLKVICGTDTLGVGVNVPIRTVVFTQLFKYDGSGTKTLTVRDFKQICGRAGRRGYDDVGYVVCQAPEHIIENLRLEKKASASGKKSFVKRKPPEKGFVSWDEKGFRRLMDAPPEKLVSSFQVHHSMLLNVLSRTAEDGCEALRKIIRDSHETPQKKKAHRKRAFQIFRGLVEGKVLQIIPPNERKGAAKVELHLDLQEDFSLNQALGLYLLDTLPQLDAESPEYALNVISLVEAILENPELILRRQVDLLKNELMGRLKNEGVPYEERLERLEEVEWPKPGKDFIYDTYNSFVAERPWMKEAAVRPKSILREMFENWQSFEDYVKTYSLEKCEGLLLRHVSEVYKVLSQTVPPSAKNPDLLETERYCEDILRHVDSSLIDEWEKLKNPNYLEEKAAREATRQEVPLTRQKSVFERLLRNEIYTLLKAFSNEDTATILTLIHPHDIHGELWNTARIEGLMDDYYAEHGLIRVDPEARSKKHTRFIEKENRILSCEQTLIDVDELNDWTLNVSVDLARCDDEKKVVLILDGLAPIA
jgi:superfamily II RNA helicase